MQDCESVMYKINKSEISLNPFLEDYDTVESMMNSHLNDHKKAAWKEGVLPGQELIDM